MKGLIAFAPLLLTATSPAQQCSAPVAVPVTVTTPNATYYNDGEPPKRFAHVPATQLKIRFGQAAIDDLCGRPPCGMIFEGCTNGDTMALPDPYAMDAAKFETIVRHELAHVNGWPASHGD